MIPDEATNAGVHLLCQSHYGPLCEMRLVRVVRVVVVVVVAVVVIGDF